MGHARELSLDFGAPVEAWVRRRWLGHEHERLDRVRRRLVAREVALDVGAGDPQRVEHGLHAPGVANEASGELWSRDASPARPR